VEISFVYDTDPNAVCMEIAEILGVERLSSPQELDGRQDVDYIVAGDPRERYGAELEALAGSGARTVGHAEALEVICRLPAPVREEAPESVSIDDTLAAFERLFDREKLLEFLLDVAVKAAGAETGSIMLYSEEADELYIVHARGLSERVVRNTRQRLGEGIAGTVAKERKGKLIRQAPGQSLWAAERDRANLHSAISVPLVFEQRLLGVLNVSSAGSGAELTREALGALERLSVRVSRVLEESRKLEETRVRHREMTLRRSMGELAERAISPAAKFTVISNYLAELVAATAVEVFVASDEGDWLLLSGSSRRLSSQPELVRGDRGALSRAYLERRPVVLSESPDPGDHTAPVSSFVFVPLVLATTLGVLMLEFAERRRLDEFLAIKDAVALELCRFIASEKRDRRLTRELEALGKVSDGAPLLLTCRTLDELADYLGRLVADALDCDRVSVRILDASGAGKLSRYDASAHRSSGWPDEDEERFLKLRRSGESYSLAFLNPAPEPHDEGPKHHSLLAVPIRIDDHFAGGIIAYDRRASSALEAATFNDVDRTVLEHLEAIAAPVIRTLRVGDTGQGDDVPYETVLSGNTQRLKRVIDTEMARADRYHHSFTLLVFKIDSLAEMFQTDTSAALALVDEITKGIQTRTRKTDFGAWIRHDTFAMVSLEAGRRVRFLVARLMLYLAKDLARAERPDGAEGILVGSATYPGPSKSPESLLAEAEQNAVPAGD
jgi:GAF domain-containing protein